MRFVGKVVISFAAFSAIWCGANIFRIGEKLDNQVNNTCQMMEMKQLAASKVAGQKIIVIGASNVMYGIRSERLSAKTGLPVVNLGLPASLGIEIILASARATLRPGDIAFLNIEPFFFRVYEEASGPFVRQALFQCPSNAYSDYPPFAQIKNFMAQSPSDVALGAMQRAARDLNLPLPLTVPYRAFESRIKFNKEGDVVDNERASRTPDMEKFVRAGGWRTLDFSENSTATLSLPPFVRWAKRNGVTVIVGWPAVYWLHPDMGVPGLQKVRTFYESLDVPILGQASDGMRPLDEFFNTPNHLTDEAAERRSDQLGTMLSSYLGAHPELRRARP